MSKTYNRTITREIRGSLGRFTAIIAIVALGVGFLVGILSSTPDMKATADNYYHQQAMSDYDIKSTMGLTEDDVEALSQMEEVAEVMPARVMDMLVETNGESISGRIYGLNLNQLTINKLQLRKGRMPENEAECVIENPNSQMKDIAIGDTITVSDDNDDVSETFAQTEFKVVGIVDSPYYFCNNREPSTVGTGRADVILYTYEDAYKTEVYTDIFLITNTTAAAFTDQYDEDIDAVTEKIEALSETRIAARHDEIMEDAKAELQDAKDTLTEEKAKAEAEFADAEAQLEKGQKEYDKGKSQLDKAKSDLEDGRKQVKAGKAQLESGKEQLAAAQAQLDQSKAQLDAVKADVDAAKEAQAAGYHLTEEALQQIAAYDQGLAQWEKGSKQLQEQSAELAASEKTLNATEKQLDEADKTIAANEAKLKKAAREMADGKAELADGKATAAEEFAKAEAEIADAEQEIADLEEPEWYILDRNSNVSYARYSVDVEKVASIATVFPLFFFLISALVALTTMTRMIEEERIQIGTLKALGYQRRTIMSKYLIYCGVATVIGCIIGLLVGFGLLPSLIFMAYGEQYDLPALELELNAGYALLSCGLEVLCTLGVTWFACRQTLKEKPSQLMVPRAPKAGKRILLERISFLWNRMSFSYKSTARNIFRYKKHLFMTIIGVAGCTALMLAAFGLQDSLTNLVKTQFDDIFKYDMRIELTEDKSDKVLTEFLEDREVLQCMEKSVDLESDESTEQISATLYVPEDSAALTDFIVLRDLKSGDSLTFDEGSAVIGNKSAELLDVSVGDTITVKDSDGASTSVTVTGITENYAGAYIYMGAAAYEDDPEYNCFLLDSGITGQENQDETSKLLQESKYVSSVEFTSQSKETYENILDSVSLLVWVLIVFSGMLAAVVLYNLTNININERIRELAALRVLGYHHKEVAAYIFREISVLSILGTLLGLVLGKILHYYIAVVAESADMVFGKDITTGSFLMAAAFTLLFSVLVDFIMSFKLRKIPMAESMKAID